MTSSKRSGILLTFATVAGMALLAEVALRILAPVGDPTRSVAEHVSETNPYIRFEYPRDYAAVTEVESGLPGLDGRHFFTTNAYGFRGDSLVEPKPAEEFRVFLLGGSTAECFYVDDADDMARVAQNELARVSSSRVAKVYNVGLSGTATDDHIAMLAQRLVHLDPDAVAVLCGVNDLRRSIQGADPLHYPVARASPRPWIQRLALNSQIVRRLVYLKNRVDPSPDRILEVRSLKSDYAGKIALQRSVPESNTPVRTDTTSYRDNLLTLAGVARAHGIALVLMTHPSTWNSSVDPRTRDTQWMRYYDGIVYSEVEMDAGLERLNDVMRAVAAAESIPLVDLARTMPKSTEYFYDDCHFNRRGAIEAGRALAVALSSSMGTPHAKGASE
jgi:lysophospholipase L1-like esterase